MGNKTLESKTDILPEDRYKIISYRGNLIPPYLYNVVKGPFLTTLRNYNDWFKLIDKDCYFNTYGKYVDSLINKEDSIIRFAQIYDENLKEDIVLGWCLYSPEYVHYIWIKEEVRKQGIAMSLMPHQFKFFSHMTTKGAPIWNKKYPGKRFNPFV